MVTAAGPRQEVYYRRGEQDLRRGILLEEVPVPEKNVRVRGVPVRRERLLTLCQAEGIHVAGPHGIQMIVDASITLKSPR